MLPWDLIFVHAQRVQHSRVVVGKKPFRSRPPRLDRCLKILQLSPPSTLSFSLGRFTPPFTPINRPSPFLIPESNQTDTPEEGGRGRRRAKIAHFSSKHSFFRPPLPRISTTHDLAEEVQDSPVFSPIHDKIKMSA